MQRFQTGREITGAATAASGTKGVVVLPPLYLMIVSGRVDLTISPQFFGLLTTYQAEINRRVDRHDRRRRAGTAMTMREPTKLCVTVRPDRSPLGLHIQPQLSAGASRPLSSIDGVDVIALKETGG